MVALRCLRQQNCCGLQLVWSPVIHCWPMAGAIVHGHAPSHPAHCQVISDSFLKGHGSLGQVGPSHEAHRQQLRSSVTGMRRSCGILSSCSSGTQRTSWSFLSGSSDSSSSSPVSAGSTVLPNCGPVPSANMYHTATNAMLVLNAMQAHQRVLLSPVNRCGPHTVENIAMNTCFTHRAAS